MKDVYARQKIYATCGCCINFNVLYLIEQTNNKISMKFENKIKKKINESTDKEIIDFRNFDVNTLEM